jgi:hypothetical protein
MTPRIGWAPRIAFAAVILALPLHIVVTATKGEPFPGLTQPIFAAPGPLRDGVLSRAELRVWTINSQGEERLVSAEDLLGPTSGIAATSILRSTVLRSQDDDELVEWLLPRLDRLGITPTAVTIEWVVTEFTLGNPTVPGTQSRDTLAHLKITP